MNKKLGKMGVSFFLILTLILAAIGILGFGCFDTGSSSSSGKTYYADDADKNNDGNVSGKEFQDLVNEFLDDNGY